MIKALAIKELRESLGLLALATIGMVWVLAGLMGINLLRNLAAGYIQAGTIPFVNCGFVGWLSAVSGIFAALLGMKQTAWEHGHSTYHFLLWRPTSRVTIYGAKIAVGITLVLLLMVVSILLYGWWASTPGKVAAPFDWSMTLVAWKLLLTLPLVYLGAFISGLRPGHWFGTRLTPLAGAITWTVLVSVAPYAWLYVPLIALGYVCAMVAIFYYTQTSNY